MNSSAVIPGLVSVTFRHLTVEAVVGLAAEAGLRAIEWAGDVHVPAGDYTAAEQARDRCVEYGLEVPSYGSYYRIGDHRPDAFPVVVATAIALGASSIRVWAGSVASVDANPAQLRAVADGLCRAVDIAGASGLDIALEFHRNTISDSVRSTRWLLNQANSTKSEVWTYWQPFPGCSPEAAQDEVVALTDRLSNVHVFALGDGTGRAPLRTGAAMWRPILESLQASRRRRYAFVEFVAGAEPEALMADATCLLAWLESATHALRAKPGSEHPDGF